MRFADWRSQDVTVFSQTTIATKNKVRLIALMYSSEDRYYSASFDHIYEHPPFCSTSGPIIASPFSCLLSRSMSAVIL